MARLTSLRSSRTLREHRQGDILISDDANDTITATSLAAAPCEASPSNPNAMEADGAGQTEEVILGAMGEPVRALEEPAEVSSSVEASRRERGDEGDGLCNDDDAADVAFEKQLCDALEACATLAMLSTSQDSSENLFGDEFEQEFERRLMEALEAISPTSCAGLEEEQLKLVHHERHQAALPVGVSQEEVSDIPSPPHGIISWKALSAATPDLVHSHVPLAPPASPPRVAGTLFQDQSAQIVKEAQSEQLALDSPLAGFATVTQVQPLRGAQSARVAGTLVEESNKLQQQAAVVGDGTPMHAGDGTPMHAGGAGESSVGGSGHGSGAGLGGMAGIPLGVAEVESDKGEGCVVAKSPPEGELVGGRRPAGQLAGSRLVVQRLVAAHMVRHRKAEMTFRQFVVALRVIALLLYSQGEPLAQTCSAEASEDDDSKAAEGTLGPQAGPQLARHWGRVRDIYTTDLLQEADTNFFRIFLVRLEHAPACQEALQSRALRLLVEQLLPAGRAWGPSRPSAEPSASHLDGVVPRVATGEVVADVEASAIVEAQLAEEELEAALREADRKLQQAHQDMLRHHQAAAKAEAAALVKAGQMQCMMGMPPPAYEEGADPKVFTAQSRDDDHADALLLLGQVPSNLVLAEWGMIRCAIEDLLWALRAKEVSKQRETGRVALQVDWHSHNNWLQMGSVVIDFMMWLSIPLDHSVGWTSRDSSIVNDLVEAPSWSIPSNLDTWQWWFILSASLACVYPVVAGHGIRLVYEGRLGKDQEGQRGGTFSPARLYSRLLKLLSDILFFPILKTLLGAFTCNYSNCSPHRDAAALSPLLDSNSSNATLNAIPNTTLNATLNRTLGTTLNATLSTTWSVMLREVRNISGNEDFWPYDNASFNATLNTTLNTTFNVSLPDSAAAGLFSSQTLPPVHHFLEDMECWGGLHSVHTLYVLGAIVAILLFYPLASLVYPNLQFEDKSVDIKYQPSFMIFLQQLRLLAVGVAVLHPETPWVTVPTGLVCFVLLVFLSISMQPCLIWWVNGLRATLYGICICVSLASLLLLAGLSRAVCLALLFSTSTLTAAAAAWAMYLRRKALQNNPPEVEAAPSGRSDALAAQDTLSTILEKDREENSER